MRRRAARWSLCIALLVFGGKLWAYALTDSTAVLSDALESVVNVVAAVILVGSLRLAAMPADDDHPYGHGKIEFFSAGIEGGFLFGAGALILFEAGRALWLGAQPGRFDLGLLVLAIFGAINAALGSYLVRAGKRTHSVALEADGRHVLADVWTTVGVLVGLALVWATGWSWLDPLVAAAVGVHVVREGFTLSRRAVRGLMDQADPATLARLVEALDGARKAPWVDLHGLRSRRSGSLLHVDLRLVVPRYFDVRDLHGIHDHVERTIAAVAEASSETVVHFDPCRPDDCSGCAMDTCPERTAPQTHRHPLTLDRATRTDTPHAH